jgi:hypothetical protein
MDDIFCQVFVDHDFSPRHVNDLRRPLAPGNPRRSSAPAADCE